MRKNFGSAYRFFPIFRDCFFLSRGWRLLGADLSYRINRKLKTTRPCFLNSRQPVFWKPTLVTLNKNPQGWKSCLRGRIPLGCSPQLYMDHRQPLTIHREFLCNDCNLKTLPPNHPPLKQRPQIILSGKRRALSPSSFTWKCWNIGNTVDGRNPAPPGMYKTL